MLITPPPVCELLLFVGFIIYIFFKKPSKKYIEIDPISQWSINHIYRQNIKKMLHLKFKNPVVYFDKYYNSKNYKKKHITYI
jgi:hypothetical protein